LARLIFGAARARRTVERVLHPLVDTEILRRLRRVGGSAVVVLDVPLLLEARMQRACDALAFVHAPAAIRAARATKARGWSVAEFRARERCQDSLARKRALSHWRIENGRDRAATRRQVAKIWHELTNHHQ
jgi:dephospho-CoA kinase